MHAGDSVALWIGTHPIEPGQYLRVEWRRTIKNGSSSKGSIEAIWQWNEEWRNNSYWLATIGPFDKGDKVEYVIHGESAEGEVSTQVFEFVVQNSINND